MPAHLVDALFVPRAHLARDVRAGELRDTDVGLIVPYSLEHAILPGAGALADRLDAAPQLPDFGSEFLDERGRNNGELEGIEGDVELVGDFELHDEWARGLAGLTIHGRGWR